MDDAGEMSAWYVFNAIGLYPYSPADDTYIVTVPLFDKVGSSVNFVGDFGSSAQLKETSRESLHPERMAALSRG